jgi:exopolysaccharide biosynthesis polyprenyl glycosylphosphotransferase
VKYSFPKYLNSNNRIHTLRVGGQNERRMFVGVRKLKFPEGTLSRKNTISGEFVISNHGYFLLKSVCDFILAIFILLLTSPLILLCCLFIKLESNGPAFYLQERLGINGRTFNIIKLRSMFIDAEKNGAQWAKKNDTRVTRIGAFIRKKRIDELPQLINVLKGDMALIGPRPERPVFVDEFSREIPDFKKRLVVKPGITGWAQVNGGYDLSPKEKLELDFYYIQNLSIGIDLKIVVRTVKVIFSGAGAR